MTVKFKFENIRVITIDTSDKEDKQILCSMMSLMLKTLILTVSYLVRNVQ